MSVETVAWAKRQRCGDPYAKAVLLELANWARPDGVCEFRRVRDIANVLELSERTVQRMLFRLEDHTPENKLKNKKAGLNLIRRIESFRPDGGQQANGFVLFGYIKEGDQKSPPTDSASPPGWLSVRGGGDSAVTPEIDIESEKKDSPRKPPKVVERRRRIAADWKAPDLGELPRSAKALARQWPQGAYEAEAEAFFQFSLGTGQRRSDWNAMWAAKVVTQHPTIMRAAKAGLEFPNVETASEPKAPKLPPSLPALAQSLEDERSTQLRQLLREKVSDECWHRLFEPAAFIFDLPGIKIWITSNRAREELESTFSGMIHKAGQTIEPEVTWVRVDTEQMQPGKSL
jgi:hypothetical protein